MTLSSTATTCALAESSDQVSLRRRFTFSITSGQKRRSAAISSGPVGLFGFTAGGAWRISAVFSASGSTGVVAILLVTDVAAASTIEVGALFVVGAGAGLFATEPMRSSRSTRATSPASSAPGSKIRPQIISRVRRGAVAPRI